MKINIDGHEGVFTLKTQRVVTGVELKIGKLRLFQEIGSLPDVEVDSDPYNDFLEMAIDEAEHKILKRAKLLLEKQEKSNAV